MYHYHINFKCVCVRLGIGHWHIEIRGKILSPRPAQPGTKFVSLLPLFFLPSFFFSSLKKNNIYIYILNRYLDTKLSNTCQGPPEPETEAKIRFASGSGLQIQLIALVGAGSDFNT